MNVLQEQVERSSFDYQEKVIKMKTNHRMFFIVYLILGLLLGSMSSCHIPRWTVQKEIKLMDLVDPDDGLFDVYLTTSGHPTFFLINLTSIDSSSVYGEVISVLEKPKQIGGNQLSQTQGRQIKIILKDQGVGLKLMDGRFSFPIKRVARIQEYKENRDVTWIIVGAGVLAATLNLALISTSGDDGGLGFGRWNPF